MEGVAVAGKLKLKKGSGIVKKKRKSEPITDEKIDAAAKSQQDAPVNAPPVRAKTKAELAFKKRQAELQAQRVLEKAQTSHRDKVEKFNKYLENMTEINDIPKVSWTK